MKSFIQSTSNKVKITSALGGTVLSVKSMLALDSTKYLEPTPTVIYLFDLLAAKPFAAYSLRQLNGSYTGFCIRVRRSTDNVESNFGFVSGVLDTASVTSFLNGASGYITTWYDQSGNASDLTQGTQASQPRLVVAGDTDTNSKPYIYVGEALGHKLTNTAVAVAGINSGIFNGVLAPVGAQTAGANNVDHCIMFWAESGSWGSCGIAPLQGVIAWRYGTGQSGNAPSVNRSPTGNGVASFMVIKRTSTETAYQNGVQQGAAQTGKLTPVAVTTSTLQVGGGDSSGTPDSKACELMVFNSAPTGIEDTLTSSQKTYYGIT